ncbi:MAG: tetratricopeptide repeat protein [Proteobacteria bacterium]|nr:tetratricopeptide repeat protein [Pseudomonadota bacterium]
MSQDRENRCARCGKQIKLGEDVCVSCSEQSTAKTLMVPCRACGAANSSNAPLCVECGALLKPKPLSSRLAGSLTGRRAELQVLEDCFNVCTDRRLVGGAIVSGDSGMGVTTLLKAFANRLTGRISPKRIFYVLTRVKDEAFAPLRGALLQRFNISKNPDPLSCRLQLTQQVSKVLGAKSISQVTETTHLLGYLAGVPFPESPVLKSLEADQNLMQRRLMEALVRFFEADIEKEPAVLIVDDMHKAPADTCALVMNLLATIIPVPLTVVAGGRPEVNGVTDNPSVVRIALEPLEDQVMRRLFVQFMPRLVDPPQTLVEATIGRAAGNPGSLNELCSLLSESGVVDTSRERWTVDANKLAMANMPVNLLDALKARIQQLDPRDRKVLEYAAVFGEVFWDEAVVGLMRQETRLKSNITAANIWADDSDGLTVSSALSRLVERQFIVQLPDTDIKGSIKYSFIRSGIRGAIIASMEQTKLSQGHFLAAQWLEKIRREVGPIFSEAEAAHWMAAGEKQRAALSCFRAARYARSRYLNQKAIKLFQKGIKVADQRHRIILADALHDLGSVHDMLGQYEAAEQCFTEMLRHAWILTHRGKAGAALNKIGRLYRARGDGAAARAFLNRAMVLFKAADDRKGVASCLGDLGELARRQGSYDRAFRMVSDALEIQRQFDNKPSIAVCLHSLGHIETARASYSQAERYLEEALELRHEAGDKGGMAQTLSTLAIVLFSRGDLDRAIARWEAALGLAEEVGDRRMLAFVNNNLGEALREQGKLDISMKHFKSCEEVVKTLEDRILHAEVSRNMGILAQRMGDLASARQHLDRSLKLSQEIGGKEMEGLAFRALGELESTTMWDTSKVSPDDNAKSTFDKALSIFRAIGNDFEVARTLHAMGNRSLERGDMEHSRELLEEARNIFERIDSKASEKVSNTINDIIGQNAVSAPRQSRIPTRRRAGVTNPVPKPTGSRPKVRKKKKKKASIKPAKGSNDTLPDMTDMVVPMGPEEE